jgi:homoserine dehydrogenase
MNGTTNFMLSKMEYEGSDYHAVLKEAQALGFAEADPTADVEGHDVQAKIALLAKLAFGKTVPWQTVPTYGISKLSAVDFEYAKLLKSTIKLIGTAQLNHDGSLAVFVSPNVVPVSSPLSSAKGPGNMVLVTSENMKLSTFAGPGAGRFPTANSVVNDVIRLAQEKTADPFPLEDDLPINNDYTACFYVRITCQDGLGIIKSVGEAAEKSGVSIHAILQNPILNYSNLDFVVTTEPVKLSQVTSFANDISKLPFAKSSPLFFPILG